jgi:hypothetical protein
MFRVCSSSGHEPGTLHSERVRVGFAGKKSRLEREWREGREKRENREEDEGLVGVVCLGVS